MEISKLPTCIFLANEHHIDQTKNDTNGFRINFRYVFVHAKNDSANGMPENVASKRILTKMAAPIFHRI